MRIMKLIKRIAALGLCMGVVGSAAAHMYQPGAYKSKTKVNRDFKVEGCAPATAVAQLNFNNARARIENGGTIWMDRGNSTPAYFVPADGNVAPIFAGALWMGGKSPNGNLKLAAVTFRSGNDFWAGPLTNDGEASINADVCDEWDQIFEISKEEAQIHSDYYSILQEDIINGTDLLAEAFPNGYTPPRSIMEWPAHGDQSLKQDFVLAPFKDHASGVGNPDLYEPELGDYPGYEFNSGNRDCRSNARFVPLFGDKTYYWVFNDKGNIHTETGGDPIGMEIRAQAFAFSDNTEINNMTFYNYVLINQGSQTLTNTYFGQWVDSDLGRPDDDYVGCDVQRGLGYAYNGDDNDEVNGGASPGYGETPPALGVDFFEGPFQDSDGIDNPGPYKLGTAEFGVPEGQMNYNVAKSGNGIPYSGLGIGYGDSIPDNERFGMRKFLYYNIGNGDINDPATADHYYNYLNGVWKDNQPFIYGGNAHDENTGADPSQLCDYMFPGKSDPLGWGTYGNQREEWTEITVGNTKGDRRFMQSAGPFTLQPGAVNNITVGVVWARAASGPASASIDALLTADDKAQSLFDNCFQILEGPDAPNVTIRELKNELILTLTNPPSSNNHLELYEIADPQIPEFGVLVDSANGVETRDTTYYDRFYRFEGYKIYQVKDAEVSVADLDNTELARLAFQCDVENFKTDTAGNIDQNNPIDILVNYELDEEIGLAVPRNMVSGANEGIRHSFKVTEDLFSTSANRTLINNKPYYFIAIAYGYNNYLDYNPDPDEFTGQSTQYLASRKRAGGGSIKPVSGIPHQIENQDGGTIINSAFGDEFEVTLIEGAGNGGRRVELTDETLEEIMAGEPWKANELVYQKGFGPIDVKIVDPLAVKRADFTLRIIDNNWETENDFQYGESKVAKDMADAVWELTDHETGTVINSSTSIELGNEEFLVDYGISLKIDQVELTFFGGNTFADVNEYGAPVYSALEFNNPADQWLRGVADQEGENRLNWIRSGQAADTTLSYPDELNADPNEEFERLVSGSWAPARVLGNHDEGPLPNQNNWFSGRETRSSYNSSIDVVLTNDRSKWTRCPVIEMGPVAALNEGGVEKGKVRAGASIDKYGNATAEAAVTNGVATLTGMSWFPGYAINIETGERLNMAFGENSTMRGENGDDMVWNPSSRVISEVALNGPPTVYGGGFHYIYVFRNMDRVMQKEDTYTRGYDQGLKLYELLNGGTGDLRRAWSSLMYAGFMVAANEEVEAAMDITQEQFIPNNNEAKISIRVEKPYIRASRVGWGDLDEMDQATNQWFPVFKFNTFNEVATLGATQVVKDNLDKIQVVPNPYYAYSDYESNRLDTRVKFTSLPQKCTISIYSVNGTLIRRLTKDNSSTIVEWDLKNGKTIPIASGVYLIHVEVPNVGERIIKWFAVMRQVDLENL